MDTITLNRIYQTSQSHFSKIALRRFDILCSHIRPSGKLLDCGCGTGEFIAKAEKYFDRVVGFDISQEMILFCRKRYSGNPRVSFFVADIENLQMNETFNCCSALDVLEHCEHPQKALEKIYYVLSKNGTLLISVPNWYNRFFNRTPEHKTFHSSLGWKKVVQNAGFRVHFLRTVDFPIFHSELLANYLHIFGSWVLIVAQKH